MPRVATATKRVAKAVVKREVKAAKVAVSEANLRKAAARLLSTKLVSTEMSYVQRQLGASATQDEMDAKILAVRKLPWASIVEGE